MFTGRGLSCCGRLPELQATGVANCYQPRQGGQAFAERRFLPLAGNCIVPEACLKRATTIESAEMSQITDLEAQLAEAFDRLRNALAARAAAAQPQPGERALKERISALESEKADLAEELERLRVKRDKDVAALDDLIAQLKPLIEEV